MGFVWGACSSNGSKLVERDASHATDEAGVDEGDSGKARPVADSGSSGNTGTMSGAGGRQGTVGGAGGISVHDGGRSDTGVSDADIVAETGTGGVTGSGGNDAGGGAGGSRGVQGGGGAGGSGGVQASGGAGGDFVPVALFIMLDRSSSMVQLAQRQSQTSWTNATNAITAFVNDSKSSGIDIGLGTFPYGADNTYDCTAGTDCGAPVVPIATLPSNAQPMIDAMKAQTPTGLALTPTECALRGMVNECLVYMSSSPSGERCAAVLVTDGTPTQCNLDETMLTAIISDGLAKGVETFALGLPGADIDVLDQYATAGGTQTAVDVSAGSQAFIAALNSIRGRVVPVAHWQARERSD